MDGVEAEVEHGGAMQTPSRACKLVRGFQERLKGKSVYVPPAGHAQSNVSQLRKKAPSPFFKFAPHTSFKFSPAQP